MHKVPAPGRKPPFYTSTRPSAGFAGGWGQHADAGWIDPTGKEHPLGTESHEAAAQRLLRTKVSWEAVRSSSYVEGKYTAELLRQNWIRRRGCDFAAWLRSVGHRVVSRDTIWRIHDNARGCPKLFAEACNEYGCRAIGPYEPQEMVAELGELGCGCGRRSGHCRVGVPRSRVVSRRPAHSK